METSTWLKIIFIQCYSIRRMYKNIKFCHFQLWVILYYCYALAASVQALRKKTERQTFLQHTVLIIWVGIFLSSRKLSRIQRPKKILEIIRLRCLGLQSSSFSLLSSMILNSGIVLSCNYTRTLEYTF